MRLQLDQLFKVTVDFMALLVTCVTFKIQMFVLDRRNLVNAGFKTDFTCL